jgi:hypothetical protein
MFSSYSLSILLLFILNKFSQSCTTPFMALWTWIQYFSQFDWSNYAVTVDGPVAVASVINGSFAQLQDLSDPENNGNSYSPFETLAYRCRQNLAGSSSVSPPVPIINGKLKSVLATTKSFLVRSCNIVDPLNLANNLGISVGRHNMPIVQSTLQMAWRRLEQLCARMPVHQLPLIHGTLSKASDREFEKYSFGSGQGSPRLPSFPGGQQLQSSQQFQKGGVPEQGQGNGKMATLSELYPFLYQFFPASLQMYFKEDQLRADLRDHPLQIGTSPLYQLYPKTSSESLSNVTDCESARSRYDSNYPEADVLTVDTAPLWSLIKNFDYRKRAGSGFFVSRGSSFSEVLDVGDTAATKENSENILLYREHSGTMQKGDLSQKKQELVSTERTESVQNNSGNDVQLLTTAQSLPTLPSSDVATFYSNRPNVETSPGESISKSKPKKIKAKSTIKSSNFADAESADSLSIFGGSGRVADPVKQVKPPYQFYGSIINRECNHDVESRRSFWNFVSGTLRRLGVVPSCLRITPKGSDGNNNKARKYLVLGSLMVGMAAIVFFGVRHAHDCKRSDLFERATMLASPSVETCQGASCQRFPGNALFPRTYQNPVERSDIVLVQFENENRCHNSESKSDDSRSEISSMISPDEGSQVPLTQHNEGVPDISNIINLSADSDNSTDEQLTARETGADLSLPSDNGSTNLIMSGTDGDRHQASDFRTLASSGKFIHWVSEGSAVILGLADEFDVSMTPGTGSAGLQALPMHRYTEETNELIGSENSVRSSRVVVSNGAVASAHVELSYSWSKDGEVISSVEDNPYLVLRNASTAMNGEYKCIRTVINMESGQLSTIVHTTEVTTQIYVTGKLSNIFRDSRHNSVCYYSVVPPTSSTKPRYLRMDRGQRLYFQLSTEGFPEPEFQWTKNGIELPDQRRSALVIDSLEFAHSGTYTCRLTNVAGSMTWVEATVFVV